MEPVYLYKSIIFYRTSIFIFCLLMVTCFSHCSLTADTPEEVDNKSVIEGDAYVPTPFQEALEQYSMDKIKRAEDDFHLALRKKEGHVYGNSYFLDLYYPDHISYLDYYVRVPGNDTFYPFKSFDDAGTFKILHVSGIDNTHVEVIFNREIMASDVKTSNFIIENEAGGWLLISDASVDTEFNNIILLTTEQQENASYKLISSKNLHDINNNVIGSTYNTGSFIGFTNSAGLEVVDAYMRTPGQVRVVFSNNYLPAGSYTVSTKLNGVMRWKEDGSDYTYPNVISIHNYGLLIALEKSLNSEMVTYDMILNFSKQMGENLKIIGQPIEGKQGLDRRRPVDTFYLMKLYELTGDITYYNQAIFNFDNEIKIFGYDSSVGGEAWAKLMIDIRRSYTGYDAGFFLYSALSIAMDDPSYPGVKQFVRSCASYVIDHALEWEGVFLGSTDLTRASKGAFCFYLTELVRVYPDLEQLYSPAITTYITEILGWQTLEGYFEESDGSGFSTQTTAYCLLALKGAGPEYGADNSAIQSTVDFLSTNYLGAGTFRGGWYNNNDPNESLYNEDVSELIWALSW